jgi:hypothetical protein
MPDAHPQLLSPSSISGAWRIDADGEIRLVEDGLFMHAEGRRSGLAVLAGKRLLAAYGPRHKVEIGAYVVRGEQLSGLWIPPDARGADVSICGRELSKKTGEHAWTITQAHAIDQSAYTGTLALELVQPGTDRTPGVARFHWALHDGEYHSFGLVFPDALVSTFCFEAGAAHRIAAYSPTAGGWSGWTLDNETLTLRAETLVRP